MNTPQKPEAGIISVSEHKRIVSEKTVRENLLSLVVLLILTALLLMTKSTEGLVQIILNSVIVLIILLSGEMLIVTLIRQIARFSKKPL